MTSQFDTLFLDRDGVVNVKLENQYVVDFSEFEFMPGALIAIHKLSILFNRIIIITNQQGIGKEIMTHRDLSLLHNRMIAEIENTGGKIDHVYYCHHLISDNCGCRKPEAGMIIQAMKDFPMINIKYSYLIGDSDSDIEAARRQNLKPIKVNSQYTLSVWCDELLASIK